MSILALSLAWAGNLEVNLEAGWLGSPDEAWQNVAPGAVWGSGGVRIGAPVGKVKPLTAVLGWQHGETGVEVYPPDEDGGGGITTAFVGNQFQLGLKAEAKLTQWLHPYATAQAALLHATVKLDDDPSEDDNLGQLKVGGVTGGGYFAGGVDFPIEIGSSGVAVAPYTELGYGILAPLRFEDLGAFQMRGFTGRMGLGLRF